ncbi:electron transport complex subunit RsxE [Dehalococcoidia bacterium]|nr:electron transport complex subunit RsxE [Dehalococcoidia bacterium]MCL0050353.1 electron transport complex subunit RsxE [Dehalococcoidia bacterium]
MGKFRKQFVSGIIAANPVFMLGLGLCPVLAVSVAIDYGIGMSGAVMFVLMASNMVISLIRKFVPSISRIPIFIVIIATFVTITTLVFEAWIPALHEALGLFLPLIVVNCIILGRAEAFASKNPVASTIADTLGATVGFALALVTICFFRELFGTGSLSLFGVHLFTLPVLGEDPILIFILPPGAFLVIGLLLALLRWRGVAQSE